MWRLACLLLFALPAWGAPFATARIVDARATHCDYEDTTTGETALVPVVVDAARGQAPDFRVCRFDVSHWLPGSVHAARMRAVDTATGADPSEWIAATLDRPASATVTLALVGSAAPPPPSPMPAPSIASYNSGTANGATTIGVTLTNTPPAGGVIVVLLGAYLDASGGSGNVGVSATGGTGLTITERTNPPETSGFSLGIWTIEYTTPPTALTLGRSSPPGSTWYGHAVAVNVTGQDASYFDVASATQSTGTSTAPSANIADLTDSTDLVLGIMCRDGGSFAGGPATNWTELFEADEDNDPAYTSVIYRTPGATGSYDPAWTLASSVAWYAAGIAIKGTAGGATSRVAASPAARLLSILVPNF